LREGENKKETRRLVKLRRTRQKGPGGPHQKGWVLKASKKRSEGGKKTGLSKSWVKQTGG